MQFTRNYAETVSFHKISTPENYGIFRSVTYANCAYKVDKNDRKSHFSISLQLVVTDFGKYMIVLNVLNRKVSEVFLISMTALSIKKSLTKLNKSSLNSRY